MRAPLLAVAALGLALAACARSDSAAAPAANNAATPARTAEAQAPRAAAPAPAPAPSPAPEAPTAQPASTQLARFDGYGDLRFGMSVDEAKQAWGGALGGSVRGAYCSYLYPASAASAAEFGFMFEGGKLVRYDVRNGRETAPGGGRLGMREDEIRALYAGRVQDSPHHYVPGGKYLKVKDAGGALVFETDASGKVTGWRAGVEPQVDYIEGCS